MADADAAVSIATGESGDVAPELPPPESGRLKELLDSGAMELKALLADFRVSFTPWHHAAGAHSGGAADSKIVYFIRHGQGFQSLIREACRGQGGKAEKVFAPNDDDDDDDLELTDRTSPPRMDELFDAPLTNKGRTQARLPRCR
jgi:hypothetical protein